MADRWMRFGVTLMMWIGVGGLGLGMIMWNSDTPSTVMATFMGTFALIATVAMWRTPHAEQGVSVRAESEKAKRRSRIERLMDDLPPEELDELRYRLMQPEDDAAPARLDELLRR
jgi:hypothetical protein